MKELPMELKLKIQASKSIIRNMDSDPIEGEKILQIYEIYRTNGFSEAKNASHHIQENIVKFNLSLELPNTTLFDDEPELFPYALKITAKTKIFQANAYLRKAGSLDIISDGRSKHLSFVYQGGDGIVGSTRKQTKASYFLFLPTSHNLELQLNTQLTKYSSDQGTIHFKDDHSTLQVRNGLGQMWNGLDQKFFTFKVGLKKIQLANDLIGKDVSWTDEFVND